MFSTQDMFDHGDLAPDSSQKGKSSSDTSPSSRWAVFFLFFSVQTLSADTSTSDIDGHGELQALQVAHDQIDCQAPAGHRWSVVFMEGIGPRYSVAGGESLMTEGKSEFLKASLMSPHLSVDRWSHERKGQSSVHVWKTLEKHSFKGSC